MTIPTNAIPSLDAITVIAHTLDEAQSLRNILASLSCPVRWQDARNGDLRSLSALGAALVIVAVKNAGDATSMVSALQNEEHRDGTAVVVWCRDPGTEGVVAAYRAGAIDVLSTSIDAEVVSAKLSAYLEVARTRARAREREAHRAAEGERREEDLRDRGHLLALYADVGIALGTKENIPAALAAVADAVVRHLDAAFARIWTVSDDGIDLVLGASAGMYTHLDGPHGRVPIGKYKIGLIAAERAPHLTNHVVGDPRVGDQSWARENGMVSFAGYPMILNDRLVGVIAAFARHPLSDAALAALSSIAGAVAQGIERARGEAKIRESEARATATAKLLAEHAVTLEASKDAAESANRTKSMFLANMSHELRTPLNAVLGYSEMLQEEAEDRKIEGFIPDLKSIHAAGKHLLGLINDILDLSKIEAGKMDLYLEEFDVGHMLDDVEQTIRPSVAAKHNQLTVQCPRPLPMRADLTKVRQTLFNVLSNAAKFTERGTIAVEVETASKGGTAVVVLRVTDSGLGMTPAQMGHLFEPFVQGDSSTTRQFGGTGLGLAISRRFCTMMGGGIDVRSELGKGSTFEVTLPQRVIEATPALPSATKVDAEGNALPCVLVIDDDRDTTELLIRALGRRGFDVVTASNGADGVELARLRHPVVITLDVIMPTTDGWSILTALKNDPELRDIPVIVLTMVSDRALAYRLGASEFMMKPIDRVRLVEAVRRLAGASAKTDVS